MVGLLTTGIGWLCFSSMNSQVQLASLSTQVANLTDNVKEMKNERKGDLSDLSSRVMALEVAVFRNNGKIR